MPDRARRVARFVWPRAAGAAIGFLIWGVIVAVVIGVTIFTQCGSAGN
jgi:hypothetical protein